MLKETVFAPIDDGRPSQVVRLDNVAELIKYADQYAAERPHHAALYSDGGEDCWAQMSWASARHAALYGMDSLVPGAQAMLEAVDTAIPPTSGVNIVHSPYGGRADFADAFAGSPTPMRRRQRRVIDQGVVKIYLPFGPSASLSTAELIPRGNAILALVMKIQQTRPVEVWLYDETTTRGASVPMYFLVGVECQPLSLAHVGFAISHPAFFRCPGWAAEEQVGAQASSWAPDQYATDYNKRREQRLGIQPCDVVFSSATDWHPLIRKPIEWIKGELKRIGIEDSEA